jgi:hypothetical protein
MWLDLGEGLLMETKAFKWLMRGLLMLFMLGVPAPLLMVMEYVGNRAAHAYCEAFAPALEHSAASSTEPPPKFECPKIKVRQ